MTQSANAHAVEGRISGLVCFRKLKEGCPKHLDSIGSGEAMADSSPVRLAADRRELHDRPQKAASEPDVEMGGKWTFSGC